VIFVAAASFALTPSAARPRPPKMTGALVTRSARVASLTARLATAENAVINPRTWVR
jgi:hypothetical protein